VKAIGGRTGGSPKLHHHPWDITKGEQAELSSPSIGGEATRRKEQGVKPFIKINLHNHFLS
jgi:hypothetical protein